MAKIVRRAVKRACDCDWDEPEVFFGVGFGDAGLDTSRERLRSVSPAAHDCYETDRINRNRIRPGFYR